jgi:YD repeat-containing protein
MTENAAAFRSCAYDGAGNTLSETRPGESFAYAYNARNRLTSVTRNSVGYATYGYNALEQLVSRVTIAAGALAGTVHYLYDQGMPRKNCRLLRGMLQYQRRECRRQARAAISSPRLISQYAQLQFHAFSN